MNSDRDIESELQKKKQEAPFPEWEPWGPIETADEYGDFELFADHLKVKERYSSVESLGNARWNINKFCEDQNIAVPPTEFGDREAELFKKWLNDKGLKNSTIGVYISSLNNMAAFFVSHGYYAGNPFKQVMEDTQYDSSRSTGLIEHKRVELEPSAVRNGVKDSGLKNARSVMVVTLAKTGIRISELCNLDIRDIYIDHPLWNQMYTPRPEIANKPDTIWIDPSKDREAVDYHTQGNKRKIETPIPIDDELKQLLLWYVITAPVDFTSGPTPFFRNNEIGIGKRLSTASGSQRIIKWAKENGLHESGRSEMQNVTAHRFRSLFSTEMYKKLDSEDIDGFEVEKFVKGLRGDVGQDVIDEYIGLYEDYREPVTDAMIKFGISTNSI